MNKKIWTIIAIAIVIAAGLAYWRLHKQTATDNLGNPSSRMTVDKHLVEIFYLPHAPAEAIVQKVEPIIAKYPGYTLKKYDLLDPASKPRITEYNLVAHAPIVIFIGGKTSFTVDGKSMSLINFPKGDAFAPSFEGEWTYDDLDEGWQSELPCASKKAPKPASEGRIAL
jgi:hypothetical protein